MVVKHTVLRDGGKDVDHFEWMYKALSHTAVARRAEASVEVA